VRSTANGSFGRILRPQPEDAKTDKTSCSGLFPFSPVSSQLLFHAAFRQQKTFFDKQKRFPHTGRSSLPSFYHAFRVDAIERPEMLQKREK
jgi:hypothetical protein